MNLNTYHDRIVATISRVGSNEKARASDAGADREAIGEVLEVTGIHRKAFAFARMLDKQEPEKRDDILRSWDALREVMDLHWSGNRTPDMFSEAVDPEDEDDDDTFVPADDAEDDEGDPEIAAEADDFDAHLAQVSEAAE